MELEPATRRTSRSLSVGWLMVMPLLFVAALLLALDQAWLRIPANWQPWGTVVLDAEPSWLARLQINGLAADAGACRAAIDASALRYTPVKERPIEDGCGIVNGVRLQRSHIPYSSPFESTCALTAALYWYERRLDEAAVTELGSRVTRIEHLGTYACRNVNSRTAGRRSQHATGNAIDISGFRLADGRSVMVLDHWGDDLPEGRFLTAARDAACRYFNTVLGPDYNELHANHFHLDLGRARLCR